MKWFVNYYQDDSLSAADRGLSYGDGVFETIKVSPQGYYQLQYHLERLTNGLHKLAMPLPSEALTYLHHFLMRVVLKEVDELSVVKIMVTRGEGGRGYMPPEHPAHNIIIGVGLAPNYHAQQREGVKLGFSDVPVSSNPYLAGMKHLNRLENVIAKQRLNDGCFEDVMLDANDNVIECIQSNLFCFLNGTLMTPDLAQSGVEGTYRKRLIEQQSDYPVAVCHISRQQLLQADEIFITNSLMGIVPVIALSDNPLRLGKKTCELQKLMQTKDVHDVL